MKHGVKEANLFAAGVSLIIVISFLPGGNVILISGIIIFAAFALWRIALSLPFFDFWPPIKEERYSPRIDNDDAGELKRDSE